MINRYEAGLDVTMGSKSREQMKWEAVKCFRDVWFSDADRELPFSEMFNRARKGCAWLIDNSTVNPTRGIVKMAEKEPDTVKALFEDLLFADDGGDLKVRQKHMDDFLDQIEQVRQRHFPKCWKYGHDRHVVSCYLTFFSPETNYIYRYSDAEAMAKYIEFGKPLFAGQYFDLATYYEMCDAIVAALKEHESLLTAVQGHMNEDCYEDESLHLMAFDFMYSCRCYGYYRGMNYTALNNRKTSKDAKGNDTSQLAAAKRERLAILLAEQQDLLIDLQAKLVDLEFVSLLGTEVSSASYGKGIISAQQENKITVQFEKTAKSFIIHRKYLARPTFEDEEQIVDLMSDRADLLEQIANVSKKMENVQRELESL